MTTATTTPKTLWLVMKLRRTVCMELTSGLERREPIEGLYGFCPVYDTYDEALADAGDESLVVPIKTRKQ